LLDSWHDTFFSWLCNPLLKILLFIALAALVFIGLSRLTRRNNTHTGSRAVPTETMDVNQARAILGLEAQAPDEQAVVAAHRRLMQRVHPDKGGSALLAQQLNEAKRVLLSRR
jgi:hypothetical protein